MLQYKPEDASSCFPLGEYPGTLANVVQTTSKTSGGDMEVWHVTVYGQDGRESTIKDYVTVPACTWKIKQLAKALGKLADFEAGRFQAEDYIGANLRVELVIEEQDGYDDKNKVKKYLPASSSGLAPPKAAMPAKFPATSRPGPEVISAGGGISQDDIPF